MITTITWKTKDGRQMMFTGRNGYMKCNGLDIMEAEHKQTVTLSPITSKGTVGNCNIEIPLEELPELIKELQKMAGMSKEVEA